MSFIRPGFVGLLCLLLVGCGVRMEIATPIAPTATPRPYPDIDYSLGGVWRVQAQPRVSFLGPDRAALEIFPQAQDPVYLIEKHVLYLALDYDVTWYAAQQSSVQLLMTVYTRTAPDAPWDSYDTLEQNLVASDVPHSTHDTPNIPLYLENIPSVDVRTEIRLIGYLADGTTVTKVSSNIFSLFYLSDPGDIATDANVLTPALGKLSVDRLLLDWRGWLGGPCELHAKYALNSLETACAAYNVQDWDGLTTALDAALGEMTDAWGRGAVQSQQGLVYAALNNDEAAQTAFAAAIKEFSNREADDALQRMVALHNSMTMLMMLLRDDEAYQVVEDLRDLRGQSYDQMGEKLTAANIGRHWGETWRIEDSRSYFSDRGSPLADIMDQWLNS